jgi:CheY-like chemotaxis protein
MEPQKQKTILLVEDDTFIAMDQAWILKSNGYQVITVHDGEKAVEAIQTSPEIDLVLMDINLRNGMDGTQAAKIILKQRDLPLIFLSSQVNPEVVEKTEGITSYGYVVKNSDNIVLIAALKMAFRLFEARQKERQQGEALRKSRQLFERMFNSLNDAVFIIDASTVKILDCNPAAYEQKELIGYEGTVQDITERKRMEETLQKT